mgnify:CR=1 FL=1|jgi:regulator of replication initiation timing|tara:strand:+ start:338 stop:613 length:276 start_codon:yes stop_codon:yes gene_type:complete
MAGAPDVVNIEQIERLAEKVKDLIGLLEDSRSELSQTIEVNERLQLEVKSLRANLANAQSTSSEVPTLLAEREQIRERVQDMLKQLEAVNI